MVDRADAHAVEQAIMKKIASGGVEPGQRFVESQLAEELGVSRIPVRESIARLVGQGILESRGNRQGAWIRQYSGDEVGKLYELREAIEGQAARLAAARATEADLQQLEYLFVALDRVPAGDMEQEAARSELDEQFHRAIVKASQNDRFVKLFEGMLAESQYVFYRHMSRIHPADAEQEKVVEHSKAMKQEHRQLYHAIVSREPDEAERVARQHLRAASRMAIYYLVLGSIGGTSGHEV